MSLYINHNLMAANAARNLSNIYSNLSTSVQRLSSGLRINSAADDAAGLAVRELMRADIAVINQGIRNASDAISMIQTAEGAMSVIDEKLIRMKELAEQAATGTYTTAQRLIMDSEYQAMAAEIDRIASATDFNGIKLLDGSMATQHDGSGLKVHFGTGNDSAEDYYFVSIGDMKATSVTGLQVGGGVAGGESLWRTGYLDMADTDTELIPTTGTFGIQTSTDGTTWTTYGYLAVEATDTLDSLVSKVNSGNAAVNYYDVGAATTAGLNSGAFGFAGALFSFTTASAVTTGNTIGIQGLSMASVAQRMQYAINSAATLGNADRIYATIDPANNTRINLTVGHMGFSTTWAANSAVGLVRGAAEFYDGGTSTDIVASAVQDTDGSGYELQLTSTSGDQIRIVQTNGASFTASTVSGGGASTTGSTIGAVSLNTGASSYVADWPSGDEDYEWFSTDPTVGPGWDGANILTQSAAQLALAQIDEAINRKDTARASLGALQNRLENTITNLQIQAENLQASESRISDVDVALEMTEFTRNNIMTQAAVSMLAQANSLPQLALQLLG